ncbi:uncharacterized protein LOC120659944 isoform X2 [Panicum virgatum]|uniref:Uncharacterized protein n=1 Tax=Panicum virgatum TaxID=38727 RepID=A0A8T0VRC6_PANVG|nr:uncharacterized protein LOC120659944 isoform X2 [Panicum virgatum]XP_039794179.1 uncharacterized protein LOC120659944 isoform X2 [Panicum virgatum]XP_039794188.1 uncharacterized protein LOC120659944 isoform X2 [Panicum virgatum]KAG2639399.1 hypothetical protein PVAP13_2KG013100 [Panicum virgatum]KAG2639400.1 hypothetical protein PVAP13_2KG013100 [Panicum virgatum]KAG2639401.1 hypothetical protein PVAP13_2KG013100 [Panicum virgatum]KAG2639402.1 hypothetical protein PVAP13_2KG013100 [Panicum
MVRFFCFSSSTTQHRSKEGFPPADEAMRAASRKDSQEQTVKSTTGLASPNQMTDENKCSAMSGHYGTSPSSHRGCCRSEDLNRYACSDEGKEVWHLKKSQPLGNILQKDRDHNCSEGTECDFTDHEHKCRHSSFKSSAVVGESSKACSPKIEDAFDASSDLISHDFCEPLDSDSHHHISYVQSKFPRSQSAIFQNDTTSDQEGSVDSGILGSRCRSVEGLCSLIDEKVDYLSGGEMHRCTSNLDVYCAPSSPDAYRTLNIEDNGSVGCSDAAEGGQRSTGSTEENFIRDGILVGQEYWDGKYICTDNSVDPVVPSCADSGHAFHHSGNDGGLSEAMDKEREDNLWNRDSIHHQSLVVEVPDSVEISSDTKDISGEADHNKTDIDGDPNELTPRTYNIKRIEDWINQIDMDAITVDEQGESSISASTESCEPTAGVRAVRPDAKSPLGMEIAYTYISKLTPASSSAQLASLGLVAIPRLSAFSGLRLLNLSGNSIVRVTAGALPKGLHMLSLSKNNISTIEGLRELTRLRLLDISYNRISRIGHGLASCSSLKELYLVGNKISEVDGLHRLLKLKFLDLRHNKISTSKGLGQLAANYNSLEAINLDGNPAQKNVGDEHLKKYLLGLLPNLVVYNKHPIRATGSKDVSDRHSRKISSSHRADRGGRSDRKSSRMVGASSSHKSQSSRHAHPGYASGSMLKHSWTRNMPMTTLLGSRPTEHIVRSIDAAKQTQINGNTQ